MCLASLSQVDSSWGVGDYEGAQRAARNAKRWNVVAIGTGVVFAAIGGFMMILSILQYISNTSYLSTLNRLNNYMDKDAINVTYSLYGQN